MVRLVWTVMAALFAVGCKSERAPTEMAVAAHVRSVNSITIENEAGEQQVLLIAGVRGPDENVAPEVARQARDAVDALVGQGAMSYLAVSEPDRYGRVASIMTSAEGENVAYALVEAGWLIVWPRQGQALDLDRLYAAEARARAASAGAWGEGVFAVRSPDPNQLAPYLDSAQIVQGRVIAVGTARDGRVFVNFGLDWRTDFTATADAEAAARFSDAGLELRELEGTVIRVRGWLYTLNGPSMSLDHPAQIELVDAPPAPVLPR